MLNVIKELKDNTLTVRLVGSMDERAELERSIGTPTGALRVNCKEIARVNSHGVRSWVTYFQRLVAAGTRVVFLECSPSVVQQINLIGNFIPRECEVESVCVPYFCPSCKTQFNAVCQLADLRKFQFKLPRQKCPKCGAGNAAFDDIESEYFYYFKKP